LPNESVVATVDPTTVSPQAASPTYEAAYQYPLFPAGDGDTAAEEDAVADGIGGTDQEAVDVEDPEGRAPGDSLIDVLGEGIAIGDVDDAVEADGTTIGDREGDAIVVPSEGQVRERT
jgi:hypothetical protein